MLVRPYPLQLEVWYGCLNPRLVGRAVPGGGAEVQIENVSPGLPFLLWRGVVEVVLFVLGQKCVVRFREA